MKRHHPSTAADRDQWAVNFEKEILAVSLGCPGKAGVEDPALAPAPAAPATPASPANTIPATPALAPTPHTTFCNPDGGCAAAVDFTDPPAGGDTPKQACQILQVQILQA